MSGKKSNLSDLYIDSYIYVPDPNETAGRQPPCSVCKRNFGDPRMNGYSLLACDHICCCDCLGKRILTSNDPIKTEVDCPICLQPSPFYIQGQIYVTGQMKYDFSNIYMTNTVQTPCAHYQFDKSCPYGPHCLNIHTKPDGSIDKTVQQPYPRPPSTTTPTKVTTIVQLNTVFRAVENELRKRYSRALQPPKPPLRMLGERIKMFILYELNMHLKPKDWEAVYGICREFLRNGLETESPTNEMTKFFRKLDIARREMRKVGDGDGLRGNCGRNKEKMEMENDEQTESLITKEEAAKTFLPEHLVKKGNGKDGNNCSTQSGSGGGGKKKKDKRRR